VEGRLDWIELVTGLTCNCGCAVCPSTYLRDDSTLSLDQMLEAMAMGRQRGATGVWFGGGEPTLHGDLAEAVVGARRLGYVRIRLQSNGLRLAYLAYARALADAGVTEVSLLLVSDDAEAHDAFTRVPGSFELLLDALSNLRALGIRREADVLVTAHNVDSLPEIAERFAELGVSAFNFWLVSLHGLDQQRLAAWVPTLSTAAVALQSAFARADALGVDASTLHVPPCLLAPRYRSRYRHAGRWKLLVVVPGGEPFMAEASPMEGGIYVDACGDCAYRPRCLGLRADYLAVHGDGDIAPVPASAL